MKYIIIILLLFYSSSVSAQQQFKGIPNVDSSILFVDEGQHFRLDYVKAVDADNVVIWVYTWNGHSMASEKRFCSELKADKKIKLKDLIKLARDKRKKDLG